MIVDIMLKGNFGYEMPKDLQSSSIEERMCWCSSQSLFFPKLKPSFSKLIFIIFNFIQIKLQKVIFTKTEVVGDNDKNNNENIGSRYSTGAEGQESCDRKKEKVSPL